MQGIKFSTKQHGICLPRNTRVHPVYTTTDVLFD